MSEVHLSEGLFTDEEEPHLIGQRCDDCSTLSFPLSSGCPRCSSQSVSSTELSNRGTLWTWTSQEFQPPTPPWVGESGDAFTPYYLGYVELPGELRVETFLTGIEDRLPKIGEEMELVVVPFAHNDEGDTILTYAFAPASAGGA